MRIPLLDILRGISLMGMILFHAHYMLAHVFDRGLGTLPEWVWHSLGLVVALTFIMLSGYVNALGYRGRSLREIYPRSLRRAFLFGLVALSISVVTYVLLPEQRISWGIIHFFTLVALLQPLFSRMGVWIFFLAVWSFLIGTIITEMTGETYFLIPLGLVPVGYFSADYYPLFPWIGYIFIGQGMAYLSSKFWLLDSLARFSFPRLALLSLLWRHSLLVYIVHTPILYGIFYIIFSNF